MKRAHLIAIALLYLFAAAIAIGTLWWPLGRDQGIFAWVGDVILAGGMPYRDAWEGKGPATHYTFALSQLLFGRSLWGIRAFDLLALAAGSTALFRFLVAHHVDRRAVHFTVLGFALLHMGKGYWSTAQPDGWATFLIVGAGALVMVPERASRRRSVLAGVLVGVAGLYKILFVGFLAPLLLYVWLRERGPVRARIEAVAPMVIGCAGVVALCVLWLWVRGALDEFLQVQLEFNRSVHTQRHDWSPGRTFGRLRAYFRWNFYLVPFVAVGLASLRRRDRPLAIALGLQLVVAILFVVVQNKYYAYHWHPVRFALLVIAAFGLSAVYSGLRRLEERSSQMLARTLEVLLLVAIFSAVWLRGPHFNTPGWQAHVTGEISLDDYYKNFKSYFNWSFRYLSNHEVVEFVRAHTRDDEPVLVWGFEPMINFLSGRHSPTRFGYNYPVVASVGTPFEGEYHQIFMDEVRHDPPRYIVVAVGDSNSLMPKTSKQYLEEFEAFAVFKRERYRLERDLPGFEMWRRVERAGARPGRGPHGS